MIIALAGRRIDSPDAERPHFPEASLDAVRARLRDCFRTLGAKVLVGSGACGADLLAMHVAGELGLRRRMVLPFEPARFRRTSVADRPGDWGRLFDRIVKDVADEGGLVVLDAAGTSHAVYAVVNLAILDEAQRNSTAANLADVVAVIVWEGAPRGADDLTASFADEARGRGLRVVEIPSL